MAMRRLLGAVRRMPMVSRSLASGSSRRPNDHPELAFEGHEWFKTSNDWGKLEEYVHTAETDLQKQESTEDMLRRVGKMSDEEIEELWEECKKMEFPKGAMRELAKEYERMQNDRHEPDQLEDGNFRVKKLTPEAMSLRRNAMNQKLKSGKLNAQDFEELSDLIRLFANFDQAEISLEYFDQYISDKGPGNLPPLPDFFRYAIYACKRSRNFFKAMDIFEETLRRNISLDLDTFHDLLRICRDASEEAAASQIYVYLCEQTKVRPNVKTFDLMIKVLQDNPEELYAFLENEVPDLEELQKHLDPESLQEAQALLDLVMEDEESQQKSKKYERIVY